MTKYVNADEAIKRLAAAQGIDVLNLVKTPQQLQQEMAQAQQAETQKSLVDQAGQLAGTPLLDPSKNPDAMDQANNLAGGVLQGIDQPPE